MVEAYGCQHWWLRVRSGGWRSVVHRQGIDGLSPTPAQVSAVRGWALRVFLADHFLVKEEHKVKKKTSKAQDIKSRMATSTLTVASTRTQLREREDVQQEIRADVVRLTLAGKAIVPHIKISSTQGAKLPANTQKHIGMHTTKAGQSKVYPKYTY